MKRLVGYLLGLGLLTGLVFLPAAWFGLDLGTESTTYEETTITDYDAELTIDEDGDLTAKETLDVYFPYSGKHGIFRFWDVIDQSDPHVRHIPHDIEVTRDGGEDGLDVTRDGTRYRVARIGREEVTLEPGNHRYTIDYTIDGVLQPGSGDLPTQLYWDLVPGGWQQAIEESHLVVHLPVAPQDVECAVGVGQTEGCEASVDGTTLTVTTGPLPARTPVTVRAGLDMATPDPGDPRPWTPRFDPVFGPSVWLLPFVAGAVALFALVGWRAARSSYEPTPPFPLMYAPPEGLGPAQAAYIFTEVSDREDYVATMMYAAERGAVKLERNQGAWTVTDQQGPKGWARLDKITNRVARLLPGEGGTFVALPSDVSTGKVLQSELSSFESSTKSWARQEGLMVTSGLAGAGGIVVLVAFGLAVLLALFNPFKMSVLALVPGVFAVFAAPLLRRGSGTKRTAKGRDLWSRIGGFHRVLSTPSSKERFDFSGRQELYTAYIPWAIALDCADEWAAKYRTEMGVEPPVPTYLGTGYYGAHTSNHVSQMLGDFSSTLNSAISSYEATQRSSSSGGGGGGFSGGGGGGGGGGGSW
ncbi:DUF2207 domain-containing protein [Nocardioides bigeumensis]|uniref:DUF2207 domain-containing protein n=1 Tax=Nocardioides bigeumensis TaxID=433657 RepID=UPI0031D8CF39